LVAKELGVLQSPIGAIFFSMLQIKKCRPSGAKALLFLLLPKCRHDVACKPEVSFGLVSSPTSPITSRCLVSKNSLLLSKQKVLSKETIKMACQ
jgi:hypothetical protein